MTPPRTLSGLAQFESSITPPRILSGLAQSAKRRMISQPPRNFNCDFQSRRPNCRACVPRAVFSTLAERIPHSAPFLLHRNALFAAKRSHLSFFCHHAIHFSHNDLSHVLPTLQMGSFRRNTCFWRSYLPCSRVGRDAPNPCWRRNQAC